MLNVEITSQKTTQKAAELLQSGSIVAIPTETVYGLAADATNDQAVKAVYAAKGRPAHNPLIVHLQSADHVQHYAVMTPIAKKLAKVFWPGPLTMILQLVPGQALSPLTTAGLDTVAIRVPDHTVTRNILAAAGVPLAAPSANPSGALSPTRPDHVAAALGNRVALVVDDGATRHGIESTIIAAYDSKCRILRPGTITPDDISRALQEPVEVITSNPTIEAPGMEKRHYAPRTPLRLNAKTAMNNEGFLAFGTHPKHNHAPTLWLSRTGNLAEAAENLFHMLHQLDDKGCDKIAISPIPNTGIGVAINDRLKRATAL